MPYCFMSTAPYGRGVFFGVLHAEQDIRIGGIRPRLGIHQRFQLADQLTGLLGAGDDLAAVIPGSVDAAVRGGGVLQRLRETLADIQKLTALNANVSIRAVRNAGYLLEETK